MQSTISLFRHLYNYLPPAVPEETKKKMARTLEEINSDSAMTLERLEEKMVAFGYEVWPWNEAYREFLAMARLKVGEHFLFPRLSPSLQEKYSDFKHYGGTMRDLHSGNPAHFFSGDERIELCGALVGVQNDLRQYVDREILGMGRKRYIKRVEEFKNLLVEIKKTLQDLRHLAEREADHPILAAEIRASVKNFEHGLCFLAPDINFDAVCRSVDFFKGRKQDLNLLRALNVPLLPGYNA